MTSTAALVAQAQRGDTDAFTALVQQCSGMAFGYAIAIVRNPHQAEDAVQEAFIVAYRSLQRIEHPERFGGWLRGIVRYQCLHQLRGRKPLPSLDAMMDIPSSLPEPADIAEQRELQREVQHAIEKLAETERIPVVLHYLYGHSQREIAGFLNLPVHTVNNRLRAARQHLRKGELQAMTKQQPILPSDFPERIGAIVRTSGPFIEARFASDRPALLNTVEIEDETSGVMRTAHVAQYLDDDVVRLIVDQGEGAVGSTVRDTTKAIQVPLQPGTITEVITNLRTGAANDELLATGIKAIDVSAPFPLNGVVGIAGDLHVGKLVLVEELLHRLGDQGKPLSIVVFVAAPNEVGLVQDLDSRHSGSVNVIYLPVADPSASALEEVTRELDALVVLSRELAREQIYPAIDPAQSSSQLLANGKVGKRHQEIAAKIAKQVADSTVVRGIVAQPFYVAEPWTKRDGETFSINEALSRFEQALKA